MSVFDPKTTSTPGQNYSGPEVPELDISIDQSLDTGEMSEEPPAKSPPDTSAKTDYQKDATPKPAPNPKPKNTELLTNSTLPSTIKTLEKPKPSKDQPSGLTDEQMLGVATLLAHQAHVIITLAPDSLRDPLEKAFIGLEGDIQAAMAGDPLDPLRLLERSQQLLMQTESLQGISDPEVGPAKETDAEVWRLRFQSAGDRIVDIDQVSKTLTDVIANPTEHDPRLVLDQTAPLVLDQLRRVEDEFRTIALDTAHYDGTDAPEKYARLTGSKQVFPLIDRHSEKALEESEGRPMGRHDLQGEAGRRADRVASLRGELQRKMDEWSENEGPIPPEEAAERLKWIEGRLFLYRDESYKLLAMHVAGGRHAGPEVLKVLAESSPASLPEKRQAVDVMLGEVDKRLMEQGARDLEWALDEAKKGLGGVFVGEKPVPFPYGKEFSFGDVNKQEIKLEQVQTLLDNGNFQEAAELFTSVVESDAYKKMAESYAGKGGQVEKYAQGQSLSDTLGITILSMGTASLLTAPIRALVAVRAAGVARTALSVTAEVVQGTTMYSTMQTLGGSWGDGTVWDHLKGTVQYIVTFGAVKYSISKYEAAVASRVAGKIGPNGVALQQEALLSTWYNQAALWQKVLYQGGKYLAENVGFTAESLAFYTMEHGFDLEKFAEQHLSAAGLLQSQVTLCGMKLGNLLVKPLIPRAMEATAKKTLAPEQFAAYTRMQTAGQELNAAFGRHYEKMMAGETIPISETLVLLKKYRDHTAEMQQLTKKLPGNIIDQQIAEATEKIAEEAIIEVASAEKLKNVELKPVGDGIFSANENTLALLSESAELVLVQDGVYRLQTDAGPILIVKAKPEKSPDTGFDKPPSKIVGAVVTETKKWGEAFVIPFDALAKWLADSVGDPLDDGLAVVGAMEVGARVVMEDHGAVAEMQGPMAMGWIKKIGEGANWLVGLFAQKPKPHRTEITLHENPVHENSAIQNPDVVAAAEKLKNEAVALAMGPFKERSIYLEYIPQGVNAFLKALSTDTSLTADQKLRAISAIMPFVSRMIAAPSIQHTYEKAGEFLNKLAEFKGVTFEARLGILTHVLNTAYNRKEVALAAYASRMSHFGEAVFFNGYRNTPEAKKLLSTDKKWDHCISDIIYSNILVLENLIAFKKETQASRKPYFSDRMILDFFMDLKSSPSFLDFYTQDGQYRNWDSQVYGSKIRELIAYLDNEKNYFPHYDNQNITTINELICLLSQHSLLTSRQAAHGLNYILPRTPEETTGIAIEHLREFNYGLLSPSKGYKKSIAFLEMVALKHPDSNIQAKAREAIVYIRSRGNLDKNDPTGGLSLVPETDGNLSLIPSDTSEKPSEYGLKKSPWSLGEAFAAPFKGIYSLLNGIAKMMTDSVGDPPDEGLVVADGMVEGAETVYVHRDPSADMYDPHQMKGRQDNPDDLKKTTVAPIDGNILPPEIRPITDGKLPPVAQKHLPSSIAKQILANNDLMPVELYRHDGVDIYLSKTLRDENGKEYVVALVPQGERLEAFFCYRSESGTGWHYAAAMVAHGHIVKGKHYTQGNKVIDTLNDYLSSRASNKNPTLIEFESMRELFNAFTKANETHVFAMEGAMPKYEAGQDLKRLAEVKAGSSYKGRDPLGKKVPVLTLNERNAILDNLPKGFVPDFKASPKKMSGGRHSLLGDYTVARYEAFLNGEKIYWDMAITNDGKVWIDQIVYANAKMTAKGGADRVIDSGFLTDKPTEYYEQVDAAMNHPDFSDLITSTKDSRYGDITAILAELAPIKAFKESPYFIKDHADTVPDMPAVDRPKVPEPKRAEVAAPPPPTPKSQDAKINEPAPPHALLDVAGIEAADFILTPENQRFDALVDALKERRHDDPKAQRALNELLVLKRALRDSNVDSSRFFELWSKISKRGDLPPDQVIKQVHLELMKQAAPGMRSLSHSPSLWESLTDFTFVDKTLEPTEAFRRVDDEMQVDVSAGRGPHVVWSKMIQSKANATRSGVPARAASEMLIEAAQKAKWVYGDPQQSFKNFETIYNDLIEQYRKNPPPSNGPVGRNGRPQPPPRAPKPEKT